MEYVFGLFILLIFVYFFWKEEIIGDQFTIIDGYVIKLKNVKDPYKDAEKRLRKAKRDGSIKRVRKFFH